MTPPPDVSIVIVSLNTRDLLRECLQSIALAGTSASVEILVVDNHSRDGSADMIEREFPSVHLIRSETNLGFAAANNAAFARARGRYVALLNSDAFLTDGVIDGLVDALDRAPWVGMAGVRLTGRNGEWQPSARQFPSTLNDVLALTGLSMRFRRSRLFGRMDRTWADPAEAASVDWVPGAFAMIRGDVLRSVGFFDEDFFLYYEEVDLCRRIKDRGFDVRYLPQFRVIHLGGESSKTVTRLTMSSAGAQLTLWRMRSALLYYRKHGGRFAAWRARVVEQAWHRLRAWRHRAGGAASAAKAAESRASAALMDRAWQETRGGRVSPARPW